MAEVAQAINPDAVSVNTLYRMIASDELPAIRVGDRRRYVVPSLALDVIVARVLGEAPPPTADLVRQSGPAVAEGRPLVLSIAQTARLLRVCRATIERAVAAGQFPAIRWNSRVTVPMKAIDEMEAAALASGGLVYAADWGPAARSATAATVLEGAAS